MKKIIVFLCICLIFIPLGGFGTSAEETTITIYKTAVAPEIDGILDDCYILIADSEQDEEFFNIKTGLGVENHVQFYACWDNTYLYLFVKAVCNQPHIAYMDNASEHYIFNAHYLMTAICPDNPTQSKYTGTANAQGGWGWGELNSAGIMYEWTVIEDSNNGANVISDHFGAVSSKTGFKFDVRAADGFDCYEQRIPLKQLTTKHVTGGIKPDVGTELGLGFAVGFTDVGTGYADNPDVVDFSNYFHAEKIVNGLVLVTLDSDLEEESAEASTELISDVSASETESVVSEANNSSQLESAIPTGGNPSDDVLSDSGHGSSDFSVLWIIIPGAVIIAAGLAIVLMRKRK